VEILVHEIQILRICTKDHNDWLWLGIILMMYGWPHIVSAIGLSRQHIGRFCMQAAACSRLLEICLPENMNTAHAYFKFQFTHIACRLAFNLSDSKYHKGLKAAVTV